MKQLRFTLKFDHYKSVIFVILICLIISVLTINSLTAPEYFEYSETLVDIQVTENGSIYAVFDKRVAGYDVNFYTKEDNVQTLSLTTWTTHLHKLTAAQKEKTILLSTEGIKIESVHYYSAVEDRSNDILIYGESSDTGFTFTLPRLVLGMYLNIVILSLLFSIILYIFTFKFKKIRFVLFYLILFLLAYILSHVLIMGLKSSTYIPVRDLYLILIMSLPVIILLIMLRAAIKNNK